MIQKILIKIRTCNTKFRKISCLLCFLYRAKIFLKQGKIRIEYQRYLLSNCEKKR